MGKKYSEEKKFPPYAFVPGHYPHPRSNPEGHSFGLAEKQPEAMDINQWQESEQYLFGIDLFNFGYYWEAHEEWESLWKASGKEGNIADFLKALIKVSAAAVKIRQCQLSGAKEHALRAGNIFKKLMEETGKRTFAGLDLDFLLRFCNLIREHAEQFRSNPQVPVEIIFEQQLVPEKIYDNDQQNN